MSPLISIITPCYNHGQYLDDAIESIAVIDTSYTFEHIIINDGSTDILTIDKLDELEAKGYTIIHQRNMGLAAARNNAIALAKGKYILPLDADNKLDKNYLTEAVVLLTKNNAIDILYGDVVFFGEESKVICPGVFDLSKILKHNYIDACAIFKKSIWEITGGYDPHLPGMGNEDWDFWIHCFFNKAHFFYFNKPCFHYRVSKESMSVSITRPSYVANRTYILKKYAEDIYDYYSSTLSIIGSAYNYQKTYLENHRFKAAVKLMLNLKI